MRALLNRVRAGHARVGPRGRIVLWSAAIPLAAAAALLLALPHGGEAPLPAPAGPPATLAAGAREAAGTPPQEAKSARADPLRATAATDDEDGGADLRLEPLEPGDPRWAARAVTGAPAPAPDPLVEALGQRAANASPAASAGVVPPLDPRATAAIAGERNGTDIGADIGAGTDDDPRDRMGNGRPDEAAAARAPASAGRNASLRDAHANRWVNFRDEPSNESKVIRVVAYEEAFKAQPAEECVHFCAVVVDGESGYIHKSFITYD